MSRTIVKRIDKFLGINNITDRMNYPLKGNSAYLYEAENINITDDNGIEKREGYAKVSTGSYTSLWSNENILLGVINKKLVKISTNGFTTTLIKKVKDTEFNFIDIGPYIFAISENDFIMLSSNGTYVTTPSPTKTLKDNMPGGQVVEYWKGRLFVGKGNLIYFSDAFIPWQYDLQKNIIQMKEYVSMIKGMDDGLYISSDKTYFGLGNSPEKMEIRVVDESRAKRGTEKYVRDVYFGQQKIDYALMWTSEKGICIGGNSGIFENVTINNYVMPDSIEGTSIVRDLTNKYQYITIVK